MFTICVLHVQRAYSLWGVVASLVQCHIALVAIMYTKQVLIYNCLSTMLLVSAKFN